MDAQDATLQKIQDLQRAAVGKGSPRAILMEQVKILRERTDAWMNAAEVSDTVIRENALAIATLLKTAHEIR